VKKLSFLLFIIVFLGWPEDIFAHSEVVVVEMTANGFEPQEIKIDKNSSVIFINKDSVQRWPASNTHPTHELYPEFDPRKPIMMGESWAFKPKEGIWKYHDHLFPHMRGVITVVGEENDNTKSPSVSTDIIDRFKNAITNLANNIKNLFKPKTKITKPKELPNKDEFEKMSFEAQSQKLNEIVQSNGATSAWKYIQDVFGNEGGSTGNIHDLAHLSGILIFETEGFEGIQDCTAQFSFGCYHGFLDKAFAKNLDNLLNAQDACLKLSPKKGAIEGPAASCIHGIGHGVASFYATSDLEKALVTCRKLIFGSEYCFDGVFMEFVRSAPDSFFKRDDQYYPCNSLERKYGYSYSFACGRNQPSLLMGRFKMGFDEVLQVCVNTDSSPFKNACIDSLGFSLASTGDPNIIINGCQKIGVPEFITKCIKAAAGELVFQEIPGWQEKSLQVCNGVQEAQNECQEHIDRLIREYNRKVQINFSPKEASIDIDLYTREVLKKCYATDGSDGCYKKASEVLHSQFGLAKTLEVFKKNEDFPEVYARCHEVTHYLSRLEYEKEKSIAKVYAQCDSTCHGGCYHGTLEAYLKESFDTERSRSTQDKKLNFLASVFPKVCGKIGDYQKPIEFNECLHGMGHAAMFVTEMELFDSLKLCDTMTNQAYKERCYTGVFMENSSSSTSFDHASIYIKADDPFYPCNILEEKYQPLCWQYQSSYFSIISNQDWAKVADLCLKIPEIYQDRCFRTIGTNQVGFTSSLAKMKEGCSVMPNSHFQEICVSGVISSLSYRFVGEIQKMIDFCSLVELPYKEICFRQIGTSVMDWSSNKDLAKKECSKISDDQGNAWCMSAI